MSDRDLKMTVTCPHCEEEHEVRIDLTPNPDERFYTAKEVARMMGVQPMTVKRWIREKKLHAVRMKGRTTPWRIPSSSLMKFRQQHLTYQPH